MAILDKIKVSGQTYDLVDSTAIHSLDGYWTSMDRQKMLLQQQQMHWQKLLQNKATKPHKTYKMQ